MKHILRNASLLLLFLFVITPSMGMAMPVSRPDAAPSREQHRMMPVVAELGQQIQALVTGDENVEIEPQETFGTRALSVILTFFEMVRLETENFATNFTAYEDFNKWLTLQVTDIVLRDRWFVIGQRLLLVIGGAFLAGWLADLVLLPARRSLRRRQPATLPARFGALFSWFIVSILPVIVFLGSALALMDQNQQIKVVRYFVMTTVYGLAVLRLIRLGIRFLLAPKAPNLRLMPISDKQAVFLQRWFNAFSLVMVVGYFGDDLAQLMRVPAPSLSTFKSLVGLIVVAMAVALISRVRAYVSTLLRGDLSAAQPNLTLWQGLRLWLARRWHVLAIAYLVIGYVVTMLRAGGGFAIMQRGTILTLLALFLMRMALYLIARFLARRQHDGDVVTSGIFLPVFRGLLKFAVLALGVAGIAEAWGADVQAILLSPWGQRVLGSVFTITSTLVIVVLIYEFLHAAIERKLHQKDSEGQAVEANARARTLLPMLRNAAMLLLGVIVSLVTLSELGVNIAPLLAGAGVIGVAIGFGSQTLVKDFLTGLFIILENTIAVGDVVTIGEYSGVVESITIRTVRLRDTSHVMNGALHILPFGEITKFTNQTKFFAYAVIDVGVAYDSDLRHVIEVMQEVGSQMEKDPAWQGIITGPTEVLGVEKLGDSSITIRARIRTKPGKQWDVKREYYLKMKERFDAEHIEIPFPIVTHVHKTGATELGPVTVPPATSQTR